jgi:hypothetical protein
MLHVVHLTEGRPRHAVRAVGKQSSGLRILAVGVIVVAALCFGREVFASLALAVPLSFARGSFVMLPRRKLPGAKIFVGFWTLTGEGVEFRHALSATGADLVVTSLRKADEQSSALRENLRTIGP